MDASSADAQLLSEGRAQLLAMRDDWYAQLATSVREMRDQLRQMEMAAFGNRQQCLLINAMRSRVSTIEREARAQIEVIFADVTKGFDFDACMFREVQQQTEKKLAEIFD